MPNYREHLKTEFFIPLPKGLSFFFFLQIESHFTNMYTRPKSPEEYLHNCLIIVNTLYEIDFDMEIQVGAFILNILQTFYKFLLIAYSFVVLLVHLFKI